MKFKIAALALLLSFVALQPAYAGDAQSVEARAMQALHQYCLPALTSGTSVAQMAEQQKLPELPAIVANIFLSGEPGKVFKMPDVGEGVFLQAPETPTCTIIIRNVDANAFLKQVDTGFDPQTSGFSLTAHEAQDGGTQRLYSGRSGNTNIRAIVLVSKTSGGNLQGLLTMERLAP